MSELQDVDKLKKFVNDLDKLIEVGENVLKDGKIDFTDVMYVTALAPVLTSLYESWGNKEEMFAEIKDMDWSEFKEIFNEVLD